MTSVRILWFLLCLMWIGAEYRLSRKNRIEKSAITDKEEKSQWILWLTLLTSLGLALIFKPLAFAPVPIEYLPRQAIALLIFLIGLSIRYYAIVRLGLFFTTQVLIHDKHELVMEGPYRFVRHPAYTGLLLAFVGVGLAMGDLIALMLLTIPTLIAFNYRIGIEETLLLKNFGTAYLDYSKNKTKRLLPWLF